LPEVDDVVARRYRLLRRIGAGGMGEVWLAEDEVLHRRVALKCARFEDPEAATRMRREGRNAAQLNHPHVVAVYDVFDEGPVTWLVMEYVESESLARKVRSQGLLTPRQAASIGVQIADALTEVHRRGLVHGDVTPENILVTADGTAKLADFGISRAQWTELTGTTVHGLRGKLRYLPPEVAGGHGAIRKSDMFMLGAALYAALEGHSPLGRGDDPFALWNRAKEGRIAPPTRAGRLTGPLMALLRVDPEERPGAAEAGRLLADPGAARPEVTAALVSTTVPDFGRFAGGVAGRFNARLNGRFAGRLSVGNGGEPGGDGGSITAQLPPTPPWRRRPVVVAAAVVLVAGAAAGLLAGRPWSGSGSGDPGSSEQSDAADRVAVMGDPRTADPCALLAPSALARFGDTYEDAHYANFDRCDVLVQAGDHDVVDAYVTLAGKDDRPGSRATATRTGGVTVRTEPRDGDYCIRILTLADGNRVAVTAHKVDSPAPALCAVADAATRHATAVLHRGPVPRRTSTPAPASLIRRNACTMLDATALRRVPGIDPRHPEPDFADWGCRWTGTTTSVHLRFDQGQPPEPDPETHPTHLAGHEAYVMPGDDGPGTCLIQLVHRYVTEPNGDRIAEMLKLELSGQPTASRACTTAKPLAAATTKHLPQP
jgi:eukaryotic-like serine/threonine-protein kinase